MRRGWTIAATALLLVTGAAAQDATFYEYRDFGGRSFTVSGLVPDLANTGYNDRASSIVIRAGAWQMCTDAGFRGRCITLEPGEYRDLATLGFSSNISSARPVGSPPTAPAPPPAGPHVVLFEDYQLSGAQFAVDRTLDNLDRTGFNDRARSAVVNAGRWEVCRDAYFGGGCMTLEPGRYDDLGELSGRVSSLRLVGGGGPYPPAGGREVRAILYSNPNFAGREFVITRDVARDLANTGFNDRAQSLRIERGFWIFCSDAHFGGTCRTFGPGDYPNLPWGLDNSVSSGRRISDDYPYSGAPNWGR
ncbi:MAG TPA: beta/gamma crystallin-related protein [Casimicrobiaceae bacterium]